MRLYKYPVKTPLHFVSWLYSAELSFDDLYTTLASEYFTKDPTVDYVGRCPVET